MLGGAEGLAAEISSRDWDGGADALSNTHGHMLLTTGNKSEMSVGYATLYGDMAGGYSVLKDAYKSTCFALSRWRNEHRQEGGLGPDGPVMPQRVIDKPPPPSFAPTRRTRIAFPPTPCWTASSKLG